MATLTRAPSGSRTPAAVAPERSAPRPGSARTPGRGFFAVSAFTAVVGLSLLAGLLVAPRPTRLLLGIVAGAVYVSVLCALLGAVRHRHGRVAVLPVTRIGAAALTALAAGLGLTFLPLLLSVQGPTALAVLTVLIYVGIGLLVVAGASVVAAVALDGERSVVVSALALATMLLVPFFFLGRAVLP
jgi:hypothetical protein